MSLSSRPEIVTLGCRLNIAESDRIRTMLDARDIVVVNSCAVTNQAVKDTRAAIRRTRRLRPTAELVVTGCASQIDPVGFAAMPEVDRVVGNLTKLAPSHWDATDVRALLPHQSRAFVAVQNGCDHSCTFCAIPAGRGASRSTDIDTIVAEVDALVAAGRREIVLTGVDLTSYTPSLGALVEAIVARTSIDRIRLSSLDSIEIDDRLFALVTQEPRVMPHLHLSFQAGDDLILKRMKRRHLRADAVAMVARLKAARRDIAIGADLIAGFPTEDACAFANTRALIDDCDIVHAHVFPYSPRTNTPAARMPQVPPEVRRERAARLREAAAVRKAAWLRGMVGTTQAVLIEKPGDRGHTPGFAEVRVPLPDCPEPVEAPSFLSRYGDGKDGPSTGSGQTGPTGRIVPLQVTHTDGATLFSRASQDNQA